MTTTPPISASTAAERIRRAVDQRAATDYLFHFWTAIGWTVLTLGLYSFYVFYQLMRRSRDHNRRRIELLGAAHDLAAQRALEQGKTDALRAELDRVGVELQQLRELDTDLRDPGIWLLLSIVGNGLAWLAGAILLDQDLIRHEQHEHAAAVGITRVVGGLGIALPVPASGSKQPHNYVGRLIAVIVTFGLYSLWWVADVMRDGNDSFEQDYAWENALAAAVASLPHPA